MIPSPVFFPRSWKASAFLRCHVRPCALDTFSGANVLLELLDSLESSIAGILISSNSFESFMFPYKKERKRKKKQSSISNDLSFRRIFISNYL